MGTADLLKKCMLCPRLCAVDRTKGETGICGETDVVRVARAALHYWEEPCISGDVGSGTVFFAGCNLRCVYCQNREISYGDCGLEVTNERLSEIFIELQDKGAANINLVTPTHFVPQISEAVSAAKSLGLKIPIVYNSSGYERRETIELLKNTVDIYLVDFKYSSSYLAEKYSGASDYSRMAELSLYEMVRQQPRCEFVWDAAQDADLIQKGVIVRQLLLPGFLLCQYAGCSALYSFAI